MKVRLLTVVALAALPSVAPAATAIGQCQLCTASTVEEYCDGRNGTTFASPSQSGAGNASVAASSQIGTSSAAAEVGTLHGALDLTASAGSATTQITNRASFTDTLTFDFGDTAFHTISVPLLADGSVRGVNPDPNTSAFTISYYATGDFSNGVSGTRTGVYVVRDNVTGGNPSGITGAVGANQSGAFANFYYTHDSA